MAIGRVAVASIQGWICFCARCGLLAAGPSSRFLWFIAAALGHASLTRSTKGRYRLDRIVYQPANAQAQEHKGDAQDVAEEKVEEC